MKMPTVFFEAHLKLGLMKCKLVIVSHVELLKVSEGAYGINGEVHLWAYINEVLLWINMAENQNWQITLRGSFFVLNFSNSCRPIYEIHGRIHIWSYVN
jgi:hypothetical protein